MKQETWNLLQTIQLKLWQALSDNTLTAADIQHLDMASSCVDGVLAMMPEAERQQAELRACEARERGRTGDVRND